MPLKIHSTFDAVIYEWSGCELSIVLATRSSNKRHQDFYTLTKSSATILATMPSDNVGIETPVPAEPKWDSKITATLKT